MSKAVEVMIQHVENLKRMYAKEHAELEELKQALLQNERSFNPLEDEGNSIKITVVCCLRSSRRLLLILGPQQPCLLAYNSLQLQFQGI